MAGPMAGRPELGRHGDSGPGRASVSDPPADAGRPHGAEPDDVALIQAIGEGSEAAFRLLFARWGPPLGRFLVRATGSREAGEDLLQEAFLRVLRAASRFVPDAPPAAWLYRICANLSYSYWRKESRAPRAWSRLTGGYGSASGAGARAGQAADAGDLGGAPERAGSRTLPGPEALRMHGLFVRDLERALAGLPVNQRMAFLLKVEQGLTYEAAAEVLGCPVGTVKSRFHYAVLALRDALRGWEEGFSADARLPARREARRDDV